MQTNAEVQSTIENLEATGNFKVLRKYIPGDDFGGVMGEKVGSLCVIDFETTGVDESDLAIEIGLVRIEYDQDTGALGRVLERYSGLEDPGAPLPEHIIALTGIKDEDLAGKKFDDAAVESIIQKCNIIIAHNAEFDRRFGEQRFECMKNKAWGCSIKDIPWAEYGIGSSKLEFIAFKLGWYYEAHRAVTDSEVTAGMMNTRLDDGTTGLVQLLKNARVGQWRIWAVGAGYGSRQLLKDRGYQWRDIPGRNEKAWRVETPMPNEEIDFIRSEVLRQGASILVERIGINNRFTNRCASWEWQTL